MIVAFALVAAFQVVFIRNQIDSADMGWSNGDWYAYTSFLASVGYFFGGCMIGRFSAEYDLSEGAFLKAACWVLFASVAGAFVMVEAANLKSVMVGHRAPFYAGGALLIAFFSAHLPFNRIGTAVATALGNMSYSMYLLHPIVYDGAKRMGWFTASTNHYLVAACIIGGTAVVALLSERYFERPVLDFGKRLLSAKKTKKEANQVASNQPTSA